MGELRRRRIDAADQHCADQVDAFRLGQPVALLLGGEELGDQVVAGVAAAGAQQLPGVVLEPWGGLFELRRSLRHLARVELALDLVRPLAEAAERLTTGAPISSAIIRAG